MSDPSVELLVQELATLQGHCLIIADENWQGVAWEQRRFFRHGRSAVSK